MAKCRKCISIILIVCYLCMFTGCYTTNNVYEDREIDNGVFTLMDVEIVSHQNNMGVLYYTLQGKYFNQEKGLFKLINNDFPYSTYSDALSVKDNPSNNIFQSEITVKETRRELVKSERVFRPVATAMAVTMPVLGVVTVILAAIFIPDNPQK